MRLRLIALIAALIALTILSAEQGWAVSLGELQAIPGVSPPYIFRLAIQSHPDRPVDSPAVTVRQPKAALSLVRKNILELHLASLTDVELEVSHSGQTMNRLLLKSELQRSRLRMEAETAWSRLMAAKANHRPRPQIAELLDAAYQIHQAWAKLDPSAAQEGMAKVIQERQRFQITPARHTLPSVEGSAEPLGHGLERFPLVSETPSTSAVATGGAAVEPELWALREGMSELMARVTPWGDNVDTLAWSRPRGGIKELFAVFLVGGCLLGMISVLVGYLLQDRLSEQTSRRQRILRGIMERQPPQVLTRKRPGLVSGQQHRFLGGWQGGRRPTMMKRRLRVSLRMTRRVRLDPLPPQQEPLLPQPVRLSTPLPRHSRVKTLTPSASALLEALERLRSDLVNFQRLSSPSTPEDPPTPRAGRIRS